MPLPCRICHQAEEHSETCIARPIAAEQECDVEDCSNPATRRQGGDGPDYYVCDTHHDVDPAL